VTRPSPPIIAREQRFCPQCQREIHSLYSTKFCSDPCAKAAAEIGTQREYERRRERLMANGLIKQPRRSKCGKIEHATLADAHKHALSIAVLNDGRARMYFCRDCEAFHVARDKRFEEQMNQKVRQLENELGQVRASRDRYKEENERLAKKLDAVVVNHGLWRFINRTLDRFGFVIISKPKPLNIPLEWKR
jgi:hypothetical protein